ncbi:predicted protein [Histoplasma capsulatum var. duboisii H88]|uniref:Predicted protein n=1 Tax=Ajellomyces capsulatus (strain H88) TaxID=544711 RepID=F0UN51_AJEC8|nr:predicted protein [Histoplasma capsulatum var. duboisii H88]
MQPGVLHCCYATFSHQKERLRLPDEEDRGQRPRDVRRGRNFSGYPRYAEDPEVITPRRRSHRFWSKTSCKSRRGVKETGEKKGRSRGRESEDAGIDRFQKQKTRHWLASATASYREHTVTHDVLKKPPMLHTQGFQGFQGSETERNATHIPIPEPKAEPGRAEWGGMLLNPQPVLWK